MLIATFYYEQTKTMSILETLFLDLTGDFVPKPNFVWTLNVKISGAVFVKRKTIKVPACLFLECSLPVCFTVLCFMYVYAVYFSCILFCAASHGRIKNDDEKGRKERKPAL